MKWTLAQWQLAIILTLTPAFQSFALSCEITPKSGPSFHLNENLKGNFNDQMTETIRLIRSTSVGAPIIKKFEENSKKVPLAIREITESDRLSSPLSGIVAIFSPNDDFAKLDLPSGTLKVDPHSEFGHFAVIVIHEMTHAVDQLYLDGLKQSRQILKKTPTAQPSHESPSLLQRLYSIWGNDAPVATPTAHQDLALESSRIKQQASFDSERLAYDTQAAFTEELMKTYPCADSYYQELKVRGVDIITRPSDQNIIKAYGLDPKLVKTKASRQP